MVDTGTLLTIFLFSIEIYYEIHKMLPATFIMTFPLSQTYNTTSRQHSWKYLFSSKTFFHLYRTTGIFRNVVLMWCCVFVTESLREINVKIYMIRKIVLCKEGRVETKYM